MNYAKFYTSAEKTLINYLTSMWFRGKADEQAYMRHVLTTEEPLMAEPVFQSIFPWESSNETFGEHASKLKILSKTFVDALSSDSVDAEQRFPIDRHPYKHQTKSWKTMLSGTGKTIVVTSGTGSGKTECFMIPVLQDIANRGEKNCVQAIFLYPLNALMKSQQKRIHAWCNALPDKITYAIYNGDTEKSTKSWNVTEQYYPQLVTRPQIRETPPQVLFTNPTMLNYMLVRSEDKPILEKSQGKLRWILLDEAHTYTGSAAAELSLQLRRVLDAFGVTIDQVNFAVTSATIGDEKDAMAEEKLKTFVSQLTGKPAESIVVIGGKRIIPNMDEAKAKEAVDSINKKLGTSISVADVVKLRKKLNSRPVMTAREIARQADRSISKDTVKSLELIDALADKVDGLDASSGAPAALLPSRIHYFIRSIGGVYACVNPNCSRHKKIRLGVGSLTTYQNNNCPVCKSQMLEVATCPSCGGLIVTGETSTSNGFRMHVNTVDLDNDIFFDTNDDLIDTENMVAEEEAEEAHEEAGYTTFYYAKPQAKCLRHHTHEEKHVFNHEQHRIEAAKDGDDDAVVYKSLRSTKNNADLCPHCGNPLGRLNYLRASATQMGRALATTILDNANGIVSNDADVLYDGKKYITFTDSRQGSARYAMGLNQDVERAWIRSSIFHKLADKRLENVEPSGLNAQDEETYKFLLNLSGSGLPVELQKKLKELEARKNGTVSVPAPKEVSWDEVSIALENNTDFRKIYKHLSEARGKKGLENTTAYLKALLIDQFGWIPKRANSLETMGFVRLAYPDLKRAKCPESLLRVGCKDADWQDFLKICLDYLVRGGRHYMVAGEYKPFLTQNTYMSEIYPQDSDKRVKGIPVSKWPVVNQNMNKTARDTQNRLVLLLCAALGYNSAEELDTPEVATINAILRDAWTFLTANILECVDVDGKGYMLDLIGNKVKLQLISSAYLCPVDNVVVDVTFRGISPRISGYIGKDNFDRFKVKTKLNYPYFPFRSDNMNEADLEKWIDTELADIKQHGVYTELHKRVYAQKPIFIAAEHSAQQSREDLDKYEKEFNEGHLNVLSCSTTMEMGVDIGGISEVVMNNIPPKSANYLQRAGRAGRRNESKALALTFCAPNPIGTYTWQHPDYPITHVTETPLLTLESRQLVQRHVNAMLFASFVSTQGGIKVTARLADFFGTAEGSNYYNGFLNHIDAVIGGQMPGVEKPYESLVRGTALFGTPLSDAAYATKKEITRICEMFQNRVVNFDKAISTVDGRSGSASTYVQHQKANFIKGSLLVFLAENSFLPSAGIPTGLVECVLGKDFKTSYPTMHLSQAISAYAPGRQVVKNEWIYEPAGILLKTRYDGKTSRYVLQKCSKCGYTTIHQGNALTTCPKCNEPGSMHGLKDMSREQRFTEIVEPAAFSVAYSAQPTRKINPLGAMNLIQPVLLEMDPWQDRPDSAKMVMRSSTPKSEILFYNQGRNGFGYALCPYCGRMVSEPNAFDQEPALAGHRHLSTGVPCQGGENNGAGVRRHVLLVGRYQTDFVEIKFYNSSNEIVTDTETLYSLGVILSRKLTELLGVNDGEIEFGYNSAAHSIFIYDTALGGAGYSPLFREYKDRVLDMAYKTLSECDCERACTSCLVDRRSQWYLNYLNRKKALEWLKMECESRLAPEAVAALVPDASAVTTDFATEFRQLTRNKNLKAIKLFIDSDYPHWQFSDFQYGKLLDELSLQGVDVSFVLSEKLDLSHCPASASAALMAVLFKHKFQYLQTAFAPHLKPLMAVLFSNGDVKTYFGEDVNTLPSASWGNGKIYSSMANMNMTCSDVDVPELLKQMMTDGTIMFDARLKKDCHIGNLLDTLIDANPGKWNQIIPLMSGEKVAIEYTDRYLLTPIGCLLLAHMIKRIRQRFSVSIATLKIILKPIRHSNYEAADIAIDIDYQSNEARNSFLSAAIAEIAGIHPEIVDNGYIEHERCLTVKAHGIDLCIRPDAGIANGWAQSWRSRRFYESDIRSDWHTDIALYNKKSAYSGILYTVSFSH